MTTLLHVRKAILAITIVAAALLFIPSAATAAGHSGTGTASTTSTITTVTTVKADGTVTKSALPTTAADNGIACYVSVRYGAYTGNVLCGTTITEFQHSNFAWEVYAIGTDQAVWHIWQRYVGDSTWSGWRTLGGVAINGVWLWNFTPTIYVVGTDYRYWCNRWSWTGWSGWFVC